MFIAGLFIGVVIGMIVTGICVASRPQVRIEDIPEDVMRQVALQYFVDHFNPDGTAKE